ncbi:hypothetical protein [Floridanema aerugineum]|uniref:LAGLIDADG homing endonuclease n=1 Tax=Floridaenema aerugineum BLCC-F46 TaxID=3153654 RepID=A0ABV4X589_9CYAN
MDRLVSSPDRDSKRFCEVGGHQPTSSEAEISIPDRDEILRCQRYGNGSIFALHSLDNTRKFTRILKWSSDSLLKKLDRLVLNFTWWRKPSSTETEIRYTRCLHPLGVQAFYKAKTTIRKSRMEKGS